MLEKDTLSISTQAAHSARLGNVLKAYMDQYRDKVQTKGLAPSEAHHPRRFLSAQDEKKIKISDKIEVKCLLFCICFSLLT